MPVTLGGDFAHIVYLQCFQMHMVCFMLPNLLRQMQPQLECTAYYIALGYCWRGLYIFSQPGWILFTLLQMINILCLLWFGTLKIPCVDYGYRHRHFTCFEADTDVFDDHSTFNNLLSPALSLISIKTIIIHWRIIFCLAIHGCGCIDHFSR